MHSRQDLFAKENVIAEGYGVRRSFAVLDEAILRLAFVGEADTKCHLSNLLDAKRYPKYVDNKTSHRLCR